MRHYLLLGIGLALASCATQHQLTPARPPVAEAARPSEGPAYTPAMLTKQPDSPAVARRLFGLLPPKKVASSPQKVASDKLSDGKLPRKCKGCTFNVVNGDQHNQQVGKNGQALGAGANNTQTGKKSGDIIKADSGSIVSKVAGPGNTQTTRGNNNTPTLTAPVQQAADWRATLAKPAGAVLAGVLTVALVGGCIFLIAAYKRGQKLTNQG